MLNLGKFRCFANLLEATLRSRGENLVPIHYMPKTAYHLEKASFDRTLISNTI